MVSISGKTVFRTIREFVFILAGLFVYAFAWIGIIMPAKIVGGGSSGIALLIFYVTGGEDGGGIPLSYSVLAINSFLIILATFIIGFKFSAKTLFAVFGMSFAMGFMQEFLPFDVLGLANDPLLSAILAGVLSGIGISICFMQGGSTGGTDIIAMIINKYRSVSYGRVIMACDFIIIVLSYFIGNEISTVIYSCVVVGVMGYSLDFMLAGNRQSSQIFIISKQYEQIASRINGELRRGVTILDGTGWYSKKPTKVAMVVCRKSETSTLFRLIRDIDPDAFITVASVMGVYGQGFETLKQIKNAKGKSGKKGNDPTAQENNPVVSNKL